MPEQAFKGTVLEGGERRYTVINEKDVEKYLSTRLQVQLHEDLNFPLQQIQLGREMDGKKPFNSYIVINTDEPYIDEIIAVMKKHGHWDQQEQTSTLDINEVIKFMNEYTEVGECIPSAAIQRKFLTGYKNARLALEHLEKLGLVKFDTSGSVRWIRIK